MSVKAGISYRQGGHHVAKKLIITTLPLKSYKWTLRPSRSCNSKDGAEREEKEVVSVFVVEPDPRMIPEGTRYAAAIAAIPTKKSEKGKMRDDLIVRAQIVKNKS